VRRSHESASREYSSLPLAVPLPGGEIFESEDEKLWRQEVVSRVQQHRARRRRRFDPHTSMDLDFQANTGATPGGKQEGQASPLYAPARPETPKIIEFPRPAGASALYHPPSPPKQDEDLELAERIVEAPRILDAPEPSPQQINLLPEFADIQLVAEEVRRGKDLEVPLQPAAVAYRAFAGLVDVMVVLMACALFVFGLLTVEHGLPQMKFSVLYGLMVAGTLWLIYQYLFLVYASGTLGMQLAQLELCTFTGEPAPVALRRWRALASGLSALALGLGFFWAFLDEDKLGWHDRITQTQVRKKHSALSI
jgi:uncharacterized RDD family membrane protein YckC